MFSGDNKSVSIAFLDLLFLLLLYMTSSYIIELLRMKGLDQGLVFVIEIKWPDEPDQDIDLYVLDPMDNVVNYQKREAGLMHLDQDDRGRRSDEVSGKDLGRFVVLKNREQVSIRGLIPGRYIVNVDKFRGDKNDRTPVTVVVYDVRGGDAREMLRETVELVEVEKDKTAFQFWVDDDGRVIRVSREYHALALRHTASPSPTLLGF